MCVCACTQMLKHMVFLVVRAGKVCHHRFLCRGNHKSQQWHVRNSVCSYWAQEVLLITGWNYCWWLDFKFFCWIHLIRLMKPGSRILSRKWREWILIFPGWEAHILFHFCGVDPPLHWFTHRLCSSCPICKKQKSLHLSDTFLKHLAVRQGFTWSQNPTVMFESRTMIFKTK